MIFKASLRAVHTAWEEFAETVGSPFKMCMLVLFLLSGFVMPLLPAVKLASEAANMVTQDIMSAEEDEDDDGKVIVLHGGLPSVSGSGVRARISKMLRRQPSMQLEDLGEC